MSDVPSVNQKIFAADDLLQITHSKTSTKKHKALMIEAYEGIGELVNEEYITLVFSCF